MRYSLPAALLLAARLSAAAPAIPGTRVASHDDLGQRRAIRGETLDAHESDELKALRRFEEEQVLPALGTAHLEGSGPPPALSTLALPDVPIRWDARVIRFLDFYKNDRHGRAIIGSWLRAQGRYRALIEEALARHHLPHALLYVAMIESGYDPLDRSFAGASGLWQFMPEAARIYGLRVDHWVDERNDPEKATEAQMRYFEDLHTRFGSYHLALAAFNAGYGAALSAVAKYNTNDYWEICRHEDGLPWETVLYVPKFLATAIVGENLSYFGFDDLRPDPPLAYDAVSIGTSITLEEAAHLAEVTTAQVVALNPELRQERTPPNGTFLLKLPKGSGPRFLSAARKLDSERDHLANHTVRTGERLETIARKYKVSTTRLRKLNGVRDASEIRPGLTLLIPASYKSGSATEDKEASVATIVAVADKDALVEGKKRLLYRVAPGDSLGDLARHFAVSEEELARWNRLDPDARLASGLILQLWETPEFIAGEELTDPAKDGTVKLVTTGSDEFFDLVEARRGRKRVTVTVHAGDTLKRVGLRYGLGEGDMERINQRARGAALVPGETLIVYLPATASEIERFAQDGAARPPSHDGPSADEANDVPAAEIVEQVEDPGLGPAPVHTGTLHLRRLPTLPDSAP